MPNKNKNKIGLASHPSNLKLPNFAILFFELPNHFLPFEIIRQNNAQAASNLRYVIMREFIMSRNNLCISMSILQLEMII